MRCKAIKIENFRNIDSAGLTFSDGVNLLWGNNAQGKTNMLEAVCFFSLGKSFRGAKESEFIKFGEKQAIISLDFEDNVRRQNLDIEFFRDKFKHIRQNGVKISRVSEMIGLFRAVLFCPEHLNIIKEGPSMRRSYLDVAISQLRPVYLRSLQRYNHILAQRNKLIKSAPFDRQSFDSTVEFWSSQLAHEAAVITKSRLGYIEMVQSQLQLCFEEMTGGREKPDASYEFSFKVKENEIGDVRRMEETFLSQLMSSHDREIAAGATLWGIHKDDIDIRLNGKNTRIFASQGQQRSLALGLKLAESAISRMATCEEPVLLLDDVFSELDEGRRQYLTERMNRGQVIMTACGDIDLLRTGANVVYVKNGMFSDSDSVLNNGTADEENYRSSEDEILQKTPDEVFAEFSDEMSQMPQTPEISEILEISETLEEFPEESAEVFINEDENEDEDGII